MTMCLRLTKFSSCASTLVSSFRPALTRRPALKFISSNSNIENKCADDQTKSESNKTETIQKSSTQELNDSVKELLKEKDSLLERISELDDKYKRALAETENVRQRMQRQIQEAKLFGIQGFCKDLLEVADILQKATSSVPSAEINDNNPHLKSLFEGLQMTETQLQKVFHRHGLQQISPVGEKFNPNFHEALFEQVVDGKEPGTISVVTKIGYKLHERTIRPALVGVVKAPL